MVNLTMYGKGYVLYLMCFTIYGNIFSLLQVKKIMNTVYQELRVQFEEDEEYEGSEVTAAILNTIKTTTLKLVNPPATAEEEEEEEEEQKPGMT